MANGDDRSDDDSKGSGFALGLLTGTALGCGLGMLFAPKSGSELRGQIGEQAATLGRAAQDQYRRASEAAGSVVEQARDTYDDVAARTSAAVNRGVEETKSHVQDAVSGSPASAHSAGTSARVGGSTGSSGSSPSKPEPWLSGTGRTGGLGHSTGSSSGSTGYKGGSGSSSGSRS